MSPRPPAPTAPVAPGGTGIAGWNPRAGTNVSSTQRAWWKRPKGIAAIAGGIVVALAVIGALGSPRDGRSTGANPSTGPSLAAAALATPTNTVPAPTSTAEPEETPVVTPEPTAKPTPQLTAEQENAIGAAGDYLDYAAFSRSGLIKQLRFEGYSNAAATFAVDHITVDWKEQAYLSAVAYLDYTHFSRSGLIKQLKFEGFTTAQATYGVKKAGL